jgi:hypothetical protein
VTGSAVADPPKAWYHLGRTGIGALLADLLCVLVFVTLGRESHDSTGRAAWFFEVWWPLAVGMLVGGALAGVYVHRSRWALRVVAMTAIAVAIGGPLRTLTDREMYNAFTIVAFVVLTLLTLGWRTVALAFRRLRG